jgi:hypothetical protein
MRQYIQSTVASASPADEIAKLADLKAKGVINDDEYNQMKAKIIGAPTAT